ncbi:6972_t:CDS:2 [Funneliformis geosporum]|uniref:11094_t:CDS:1 n=1 Tax=Funneliformis geosporum TaxID=1117311 RepID=A0A9W4SUZ2_9GLOM|nr:11094_t:CDS:2 [Funneliformis geosporum]CAI2182531.1 6972_t:CDS:2 [Funneliformis geosporum]
MYLISVPNLPPVFSVIIGPQFCKANVTADTMVELLLKCFKTYIKDEIHDYNLEYVGKVLQNTDTLKNLGIKQGDFIKVVQIPFKLYVKTQDGKAIEFLLKQHDTIHQVKQMVQEREDIPDYKQRLYFNGKQLDDNTTLKSYNIQKGSTLELILTTIKLYVKTQDEKAIELHLMENNTINDVKKMVQKCINIPVHRQRILFGGKQLDDSSTMKFCNIQNESTLVLTTTPFKLCVKTQDGQVVEIYVTEYNTIREVKQMIQKCEGIPINKQCLYYHLHYGKQLSDSNILKYYSIREGARLELLLAILVHVKTLSGKSLTLSICDNRSIFPRVGPTLHLVLRLRGGMFDETSGRIDFNALPSLMQYMHVPERHLVHDKVHVGIACNYCGKSGWKGARYKCSECFDYDLCYDCIKMSKLLHDVQHNFSELLDPENQNDFPKEVLVNPVTIVPILPTKKEEMLNLLQEEEKRRFSPELQQKYYDVGSDPTSGKDWMDVTDQMQHELVREFGYSGEAVELLRRAPQLYKDDSAFQTTQVYVRNNIASIGNLKEGMPAPDCSLVPLNNDKTITQLRSLYQPGRPLVLLAGSHTCPLYRYISHVLNDIYNKYQKDVDFYMIQIREAHASDVWPIGNIVNVKEHRTLEERLTAARNMVEATQLEISVLADTMDNTFLKLYSPWPFRFFVIVDGNFKLVGMPKEARYDTTDLVNCLDALLDEKSPESKPDTPEHKKRT